MLNPEHFTGIERNLLGALLIRPAFLDLIELSPADFYRPAHQRIFRAILDVNIDDEVDLVTVKQHLDACGLLDEVGGPGYLASLLDEVPHQHDVIHFASIVRECAQLREMDR